MKQKRRKVELVVISDIHLGTYGCHAAELNKYLKSINPKTLILNGDIIDFWQFSKRYWPKSHMKVVKQIINMASKGSKIIYLTGNHDETLRKFEGTKMGNFRILNQYVKDLDGKKVWFFHGDIFDVTMQYSKWLAKIGAVSYDTLILINTIVNNISEFFGRGKISLSKKIKDNVKSAVAFINSFEQTAADLGIQKGYDYIVCGHIHHPEDRIIEGRKNGNIRYLNSGDWVENLTSLEYNKGEWAIYNYFSDSKVVDKEIVPFAEEDFDLGDLDNKELFNKMLLEFRK